MDFFRRHLWTGVLLLVGPTISIGSLLLHAYALKEMGLPVEVWVAMGLGTFFLGVIGILMKWDQEHKSAPAEPHVASFPPISAPKSVPRSVWSNNNDRVFVDITMDTLWDMIKGKMMSERDRMVKPFIGKWINLSVVVDYVSCHEHMGTIWVDGIKLLLHFDPRWNDRLEVLQKGQRVSAIGEIERVAEYQIVLKSCELR